jgi:ABC-type nickel/cobalt efflux system permease component RcnA
MRFVFLLILLLGMTAFEAQAQESSPFTGGSSAATPEPAAAGGFLQPLRHQVYAWQRDVNRALNQRLVAIRRGEDRGALWAGILFAFLYGVFHALGPGHGKSVVIGYFLGRDARPARGIAMASWIAVSHVVGAVVIVGLAHFILSRALVSPTSQFLWLRVVSYGAILVIGLLMLREWWRGGHAHRCGHDHDHDHHLGTAMDRTLEQRALAVAAGFVPCSGAILVLLFALANGLVLAGIAMAGAIAFGMGLTLALLGIASIFLRRQVSLRLPRGGRWSRFLALLGPLFVIAIGGGLLLLALGGPTSV